MSDDIYENIRAAKDVEDIPQTRAEYWAEHDGETVVEYLDNWTPDQGDRTRTIAYYFAGIGIPVVGLATAVVAIWFPEYSANVAATAIAINTFIGGVAGVFGILNRPTKNPVIK